MNRQVREWEDEMTGNKYGVMLSNSEAIRSNTTQKIAVLLPESALIRQLDTLLRQASNQEAVSGCVPVFRDALVFYSEQGKQIRVLNICFECLLMMTDDLKSVGADFDTYQTLRMILIELGHPIERR